MKVIEVFASPHNPKEFLKRPAPFRPPGLIGCQVAGDNVRRRRWTYLTEILPSAQVGLRIEFRRSLAKVWIVIGCIFGRGASAVATTAGGHGVDEIASQPH